MFLISGLHPTMGVYISIFKVDLVGNKRLLGWRYEMDILTFNLLFKLQIDSRYQISPDQLVRINIGGIKGFRTVEKPILYSNYVSLIKMVKIEY